MQLVEPASLGLTLSPVAPLILTPVTPAALALTLDLPTSGLQVAGTILDPGLSLTLTPQTPLIGQAVPSPEPASLALTLTMPTTGMQAALASTPTSIELTLDTVAPTVTQGAISAQEVSPAAIALVATPEAFGTTYWSSAWGAHGWGTASGGSRLQVLVETSIPSLGLSLGVLAPTFLQLVHIRRADAPFWGSGWGDEWGSFGETLLSLALTPVTPEVLGPPAPTSIELSIDVEDIEVVAGVGPASLELTLGTPEPSIPYISPEPIGLVITPEGFFLGTLIEPAAISLSLTVSTPDLTPRMSPASIALTLSVEPVPHVDLLWALGWGPDMAGKARSKKGRTRLVTRSN
jgi:hypothetical protein